MLNYKNCLIMKKLIVKNLTKIFYPLVKLCIKEEIQLNVLIDILKRIYVDVSIKETISDKKITDSRISFITGVHRKDVKKFRGNNINFEEIKPVNPLKSKLISIWMGDKRFSKIDGTPKKLSKNGLNSFETLTNLITRDIPSKTILDELMDRKIVFLNKKENTVSLNLQSVNQNSEPELNFEFLGDNVSDHIKTINNNLYNEKKLIERAVFFRNISRSSINQIEEKSIKMTNKVLKEINELAYELNDEEDNISRFRLGIYFYRDDYDKK